MGLLLVAVGAASALAGCTARRPPVLEPLARAETRAPVVLIPGITGSKLRERDTGAVRWGNARSLFFPRDGGYSLALPIGGGGDDRLEAFAPVTEIRLLGLLRFEIYSSVIRLMEANGYRLGSLDDPHPGDSFFFFPYDWRHGAARSAGELARRLETLRRVRGEPVLRVHLICQSNAAHIARYFLKYGGAPLEAAEAGTAAPERSVEVDKLVLIGAASGGALRTLEDLQRGRRYVPWVGRRMRPEVVFTMTALYEALPFYRDRPFFDEQGRTLEVDLFDGASWDRYGWSIYAPKPSQRASRARNQTLFGDRAQRAAFLAGALDRARRLHAVLLRDVPGFGSTRYYSIQNDAVPTPDRALLERRGARWSTRLAFDRRAAERWPLAQAPGDGHATVESQGWLSPQEHAALAHPPFRVDARHRKIVLHPEAHRRLLEILAE